MRVLSFVLAFIISHVKNRFQSLSLMLMIIGVLLFPVGCLGQHLVSSGQLLEELEKLVFGRGGE